MLSPEPNSLPEVQALFVQHISAVRGFVFALMPDPHRAADVVQETFLTVTAKADAFERGTNFKAWVFAIARNKVLQARARGTTESGELLSEEIIESLAGEAVRHFEEHDARLPHLRECIERLAPQARKMIALRYDGTRALPDVAAALGWSVESVKVALSKARAFLRDCVMRRATTEMP